MRRRLFARQESRTSRSDQLASECCDDFSSSKKQWPPHSSRRVPAGLNQMVTVAIVSACWLVIAQDQRVHSQQLQISSSPMNPPSAPNTDFSHLARLFQLRPSWLQSQSSYGWAAAADPNNRTTMRFFRNNKTFASVVYANELQSLAGVASHQLYSLPPSKQQQQQQHNTLNRLINCHLVDLEKHSSDVSLFESKYAIRTVDIEFADMMQLIEACTEIARLRMPPINRLLAAVGPGVGGNSSGGANRLLVVGRPIPVVATIGAAMTTGPTSPISLTATTQTSANELPASPSIVVAAAAAASSSQEGSGARSRRRIAPQAGGQQQQIEQTQAIKQFQHQHQHQHSQQQMREQQQREDQQLMHRLTLGEVTPPASLVVNSKLREAVQEITSYDSSELMSIWRGILPGTNWCGMGDRATSYNDLGFESDIDICCRAHDFCPIRLSAFSSGYGLFNWSFYTRSHCRCDQNFLDCLRRAESPLASVVMKFYFAIMKTTCLHENQTALDADASSSNSINIGDGSGLSIGGSKQHSHGISMRNGNKLLAGNKLFEQLRAKLPIPRAVERSQVLLSKLDSKPR